MMMVMMNDDDDDDGYEVMKGKGEVPGGDLDVGGSGGGPLYQNTESKKENRADGWRENRNERDRIIRVNGEFNLIL